MKRTLVMMVLLLASACGQPSPGDEALAELDVSLRAEADMVRRGVGLREIFNDTCTDDCSGHRAGYIWALDNGTVTQDDCDAAFGESFAKGCRRGLIAASFAD